MRHVHPPAALGRVLAVFLALAAAMATPAAASGPGRPTGLTLTAKTASSVTLHWNAAATGTPASAFEVLRDGVVVGSSASTGYTCDGLTAARPANFRVRARDAQGNLSETSNALMATPADIVGAPAPVRVKTEYRSVVLNYVPSIVSGGKTVKLDEQYGYRDVDGLVEQYRRLMRRASGGQVNWTVARRFDLDEFPRAAEPGAPSFNASNYEYLRSQGYDYWNNSSPRGPDYRAMLDDPRFGLIAGINDGTVDAVWVFAPGGTGFWETSMAGPGAYYVNGGTIDHPGVHRRVVFYGFGKEGHQGVGFMCENTAHMAEVILRDNFAPNWPRSTQVPVFPTLNLGNPARRLAPALVNDWTRLTLAEAASWDAGLVSPGHSQAGLSHFPPTAMYNYDWNTVNLVFNGVDPLTPYDGAWHAEGGELRADIGNGVKALAFDGMGLSDGLGAYHPPMAFSDGDVEFSVRLSTAAAGSHAGLLCRVSYCAVGPGQVRGYYVGVGANPGRVFVQRLDGGATEIASANRPVQAGVLQRVRVELRGTSLKVFLGTELDPVIAVADTAHVTGGFGFTTTGTAAAFASLSVVSHASSTADDWYSYPVATGAARDLSPLEWNGDGNAAMDGFYAWWWEHLPKNGGFHEAADLGTGMPSRLLNTWWPYVFDLNAFTSTVPAPDIEFAPEDRSPPAIPGRIIAVALGATKVGLSWDEPDDDVGVTRYGLYRDGVLLRKTGTPYVVDTRIVPGSTHAYGIRAFDGSGNASAASPEVVVTTPSAEQPDRVVNGGFEFHPGASGWLGDAFRPDKTRFTWELPGTASNPSRCVSIEALEPGDSRWLLPMDGLQPSKSYWLTGRVRGENVVPAAAGGTGASLCLFGTWDHTGETLTGNFDWRRVTLPFVAPASGGIVVGARLGYWGNLASGKVWFDDIALVGPDTLELVAGQADLTAGFVFELMTTPGRRCRIERSEDLRTWTPLWTVVPDAPVTPLADPDAAGTGTRFYRAVRD